MSRIGVIPVEIPNGVEVKLTDMDIDIKGAKGSLSLKIPSGIKVASKDQQVTVFRINDEKVNKAKHGLIRSLINNMVIGVTEGYEKQLEVEGVGFKVNASGNTLKMSLGFSHETVFKADDSLDINVDGNLITISGIDKQLVGHTASEIRSLKPPEPYKGKGIKYVGEQIIRKAGKSAVVAE